MEVVFFLVFNAKHGFRNFSGFDSMMLAVGARMGL